MMHIPHVSPEYVPYVISAVTGVIGVVGGAVGAGFWQRKWVSGTDERFKKIGTRFDRHDKKLDYLNSSITTLITKVEVSLVLHNKTDGALTQVQKALNETNSSVGAVERKAAAMWGFLEGKFKSELSRLSDRKT